MEISFRNSMAERVQFVAKGGKKKSNVCDACGNEIKGWLSNLRLHRLVCSGDQQCNNCERKFKYQVRIFTHVMT